MRNARFKAFWLTVDTIRSGEFPHRLSIQKQKKKPTEIWENNASCIMMSENPTNHEDMSMSKYTISVTWFETAM
jgi:hypothetical protein